MFQLAIDAVICYNSANENEEGKHILYCLVSDMAFLELGVLLEKAGAVLECITEDLNCSRDKTLSFIASEYIAEMGAVIQAMQKNIVKAPAA